MIKSYKPRNNNSNSNNNKVKTIKSNDDNDNNNNNKSNSNNIISEGFEFETRSMPRDKLLVFFENMDIKDRKEKLAHWNGRRWTINDFKTKEQEGKYTAREFSDLIDAHKIFLPTAQEQNVFQELNVLKAKFG